MKKYLLGIAVIVLISSCNVTIIEDPYDPRDNFLGRFEAEEYSETLDVYSYFNLRILKNTDPYSREIYLQNFYGADIEVYGEVNGSKLTIPRQVVGYYIIEGLGTVDFDQVVMTYTVEDTYPGSRLVDYCNTVFYRR